jgi:hypothetical protein
MADEASDQDDGNRGNRLVSVVLDPGSIERGTPD